MAPVSVVLLILPSLCAALNLTIPETVQAGVPTEITVGFDFWKQRYAYAQLGPWYSDVQPVCYNPPDSGCSTDALYQHYRLYLFYSEWMDMCYLTDLIPIGTTNPNITIPSDLGPADTYSIDAIEFNGTVMYMPPDGVASSNPFRLANTSVSSWTKWEKYGGWVKPYDSLPCSSYACFRACGLRYSDADGTNIAGTTQDLFDCWNSECAGVVADPTQPDSLWTWYCNVGDGCAGMSAPSGATTPVVPTNVIPTTLVGSAYPSGEAAEGATELPTATATATEDGAGASAGSATRSVTATATASAGAAARLGKGRGAELAGWDCPAALGLLAAGFALGIGWL
ncbi:hypothetical protein NKR23_g328 [Pleurostoma richardsiae]|uniref:Uncharacterized protein n=1 Tax=Pleurostoma richardsiae TaxID=41990 RepID=A0AA38VLF7_9PEZI|nr:hypothetical protein NKR23_g328 [Pleurostoma richardsiae]